MEHVKIHLMNRLAPKSTLYAIMYEGFNRRRTSIIKIPNLIGAIANISGLTDVMVDELRIEILRCKEE